MKILYITKFFPPEHGGIEILSKNICDFFFKKKHNVEVCSFSKNKTFKSFKYKYKINFFKTDFNLFSTPISFKMIIFLTKNVSKFDYIHIHKPNPWPTIILYFLKTKKIIISWGSDIVSQKYTKFFFNLFQKSLLNRAHKIICLSKTYKNSSSDLKKYKKKIKVIPPIITSQVYKKKIKKNKNFNIISIGRLVEYKSFNTAIEAMNYLPSNFNLTIIGNGNLYDRLNNLIIENKLKKRVKILRNINEIKKINLMKKSDLYLMCSNSRAESFGISILEAISLGMPIVISHVRGSGMNDLVINNYNGLKFKINSPEDCSKKILKVSKSKKIIETFSKNSIRHFTKNFNNNLVFKNLNKIYD